jgi:putative ABC transport system permease protein
VALLVGGVGVANTMVISVLERRAEIGPRRSLGATREQVRIQFLAESLLLSALGGAGGAVLGAGVTAVYASYRLWPVVVPLWAVAGGAAATLLIGGLAGLYPAVRAARLSPTEALAPVSAPPCASGTCADQHHNATFAAIQYAGRDIRVTPAAQVRFDAVAPPYR